MEGRRLGIGRLAIRVPNWLWRRLAARRSGAEGEPGPTGDHFDGLTEIESDLLALLALGLGSKEIADRLGVTIATLSRHLVSIYGKIGARGATDVNRYAIRSSLRYGSVLGEMPGDGNPPLAFMTPEHHRVRDFVVLEMPRRGMPLSPEDIALGVDLSLPRVAEILDDLERHLAFLYRNREGAVTWAYPVTVERRHTASL